ncbi:MAG TPA: ABC transporter substrate-binding protein, partial [Clostridia bacterium]|nr:ABC transporter substrate-binding protein [Clostridia bacterium]
PDVIVTTIPSSEDGTAGVNEILARVGWESVQAIADKKVFYIDGELLSRPGPRLLDVVNALYVFLYETPAE